MTRAAIVRECGGPFIFKEIELDDPRPGEVLVRIVACGICHTDIAARDGLIGTVFPAVLGHEGAGVVEKVGSGVGRVRVGQRVVLSFSSCGKCSDCQNDRPAGCEYFDELNFDGKRLDGSNTITDSGGKPVSGCFFGQSSFAFHALTRERNLIVVDAPTDDELALLAPFGCGVQAGAGTVLNQLKPCPGDSFVVFGTGTVGLSALMAARMAKAGPIIAVDVIPSRLELARKLGADFTVDARTEDFGARMREIAAKGVDYAVETTGLSKVIDQAIRSLGPNGELSKLGVPIDAPGEKILPQKPGSGQNVFYSIAGDSNPQTFIPFLIKAFRDGKFPVDVLLKQYPALKIGTGVRDSLSGLAVKPVLRF